MFASLFFGKKKKMQSKEESLLRAFAEFRDEDIRLVMTPRGEMLSLDVDCAPREAAQFMMEHNIDAVLVYHKNLDHARGVLTLASLMRFFANGEGKQKNISPLLDKIISVPAAMRRVDAFYKLAHKKAPMAVIYDEYGGVDGYVTMSSLIQSLGDATGDALTAETEKILPHKDGSFTMDARLKIDALEEQCGNFLTKKEREEIETLGGLVISLAGHIPARGEMVTHSSGWRFKALAVDVRRIHLLYVFPPEKNNEENNEERKEKK